MPADFPELTSFGTLLKFALALEQTGIELANQAQESSVCAPWTETLSNCAKKHTKREKQLERLRQERLNEVVLQPIEGIERAEYLPTTDVSGISDGRQIIKTIIEFEEITARFYTDAAKIADDVLGGLPRTFLKLAEQSKKLADELVKNP
jgi:rubrerythrin